MQSPPSEIYNSTVAQSDRAETSGALEQLVTLTLAASVAVLVVLVLPIYLHADSFLDCRYGWSSTAAFLKSGWWTDALTVIGGLVLGGGVASRLVVVGTAQSVVMMGTASQWGFGLREAVVGVSLYALVVTFLTLVNISFALAEENVAVGPIKYLVIIGFAIV